MSGSTTQALRQRFLEARFFPSLDGLRAMSIVPVVFHHCTPRPLPGVLGRGPIGVDLFFAISGFLITTLLVRERQSFGRLDLFGFYGRRALRIFPLYYLALLLHAVYALWVRPELAASRDFVSLLPAYATYTANWIAPLTGARVGLFAFAWSLCTEEQFYIVWAPCLAWCRRLAHAAWAMAGLVILDLLLEHGSFVSGPGLLGVVTVIVRSFATPIGLGALLALVVHHPTLGRVAWPLFGHRAAAPGWFAFVVTLVIRPVLPIGWLHLGLAMLVLSSAVRRDHGLSWLLDRTPLSFVGRISYGIYLWHVPVIGGLKAVVPTLRIEPFLLFAAALPLSIALAAFCYRVYEKPFLSLGQRYFARRGASPGASR